MRLKQLDVTHASKLKAKLEPDLVREFKLSSMDVTSITAFV